MENPPSEMPPLFHEVFLAFDAGEYPHRADPLSVDPVAKYTDPWISEIVTRHGSRQL
ncbi:hypothetical protein [Sphingosinicella sp. BN140058]|uniref:hypothetical protein n=1 Tax=Sphingosinicella sp. BN140058 TaxID=1892855 RepID=UPI0013EBB9EA|nr:hypothetical protein [Sphingosinicella sp. BN140058]